MILLRIATINKYCYNNEINKTTTTDRFDINKKILFNWRYDEPLSIYARLVGMTI